MRTLVLAAIAGIVAVSVAPSSAARPGGSLTTAVSDANAFAGSDAGVAFRRVRASGATAVRVEALWTSIAPARPSRPTDPADPVYAWAPLDAELRLAAANGLRPILSVWGAPAWARAGPGRLDPVPADFGRFATALATRYSGRYRGLPRVRHWKVWNEPNATTYLAPQLARGRVVSAAVYRSLVNAFAGAVHRVSRANVVIAGALSPFTVSTESVRTVGPMRFMRELLCMSDGRRPRPTCGARVEFDVWAHHPYTSGGPTHKAFRPDDVSLGDLGKMRRLLEAAVRARRVVARQRVPFWVTEFSWDTKPPDRGGVPTRLHSRWVAEALYRMWDAGVSLVTWYLLRDQPVAEGPFQSGLFWNGGSLARDRAKPALQAFRFPFVAFRKRGGIFVWGRTPAGRPARVIVERRAGRRWRAAAVLRTNGAGIFTRQLPLRSSPRDSLRARIVGRADASLGFSLTRPRDRFVRPFGMQ